MERTVIIKLACGIGSMTEPLPAGAIVRKPLSVARVWIDAGYAELFGPDVVRDVDPDPPAPTMRRGR